jgi:hypothetical protein
MSETTDIVPECDDCAILGDEIERLTAELEEREEPKNKALEHGGPIKRLFARLFGPLIYDGEETCGHCKYWKRPENLKTSGGSKYYGDCKLLVGKRDTVYTDTCHRFTPRRRYMRRVKPWLKKA